MKELPYVLHRFVELYGHSLSIYHWHASFFLNLFLGNQTHCCPLFELGQLNDFNILSEFCSCVHCSGRQQLFSSNIYINSHQKTVINSKACALLSLVARMSN